MLRVDLKANGYRLSAMDQDRMNEAVAHLDRLTNTYPTPRLHVAVEKLGHTDDVQVRMVLFLSRRRLVAVDKAPALATAAQKCADVLSRLVEFSKERVHRNHGERTIRRAKEEAGTYDPRMVRRAHLEGDYEQWKAAVGDVDEVVEAEIGRRLKYHPDAEALLGEEIVIQDLVESVLLYSFEHFAARPENVPFREWILSNIDVCIDEVVKDVQGGEEVIRPTDQAA